MNEVHQNNLMKIRETKKVSRKDFAKKLQLSVSTLKNYENVHRNIPIRNALLIAKECKVSLDYIYNLNVNSKSRDFISNILFVLKKVFKIEKVPNENGDDIDDVKILIHPSFMSYLLETTRLFEKHSYTLGVISESVGILHVDINKKYRKVLNQIFSEEFNSNDKLNFNVLTSINSIDSINLEKEHFENRSELEKEELNNNVLNKILKMSSKSFDLADAAVELGENESTINDYISGKPLSLNSALKLAEFFEVSFDWMFDDSPYMNYSDEMTHILFGLSKLLKMKERKYELSIDLKLREFIYDLTGLFDNDIVISDISLKKYYQLRKMIFGKHKEYLETFFYNCSIMKESKFTNSNLSDEINGINNDELLYILGIGREKIKEIKFKIVDYKFNEDLNDTIRIIQKEE